MTPDDAPSAPPRAATPPAAGAAADAVTDAATAVVAGAAPDAVASAAPDVVAPAGADAGAAGGAVGGAAAGPAVQLARHRLVRLLDAREWTPGSQLPGERALAKQVGVSRSSLRQALARLEEEGRVYASAQRGWFVRSDMVSEPPSLLKSFSEVARARGLTATARVLSRETRAATYEEAQRLRTAPTSPVLELIRVRGLDDVPVCVDTTVILGTHAGDLRSVDLTDKSLFSLLEEGGLRVTRSAYTAHAAAADHRIAELLHIPAGSPVLVCDEVTHDQNDAPVLLGRAVYRGDAYRFEATLLRGA